MKKINFVDYNGIVANKYKNLLRSPKISSRMLSKSVPNESGIFSKYILYLSTLSLRALVSVKLCILINICQCQYMIR